MNTCRVSKIIKQYINLKVIVAKLLKYRILFNDILTFLGLDNRNASLKLLYLVVLGIIVTKNQINNQE